MEARRYVTPYIGVPLFWAGGTPYPLTPAIKVHRRSSLFIRSFLWLHKVSDILISIYKFLWPYVRIC